MKLRNHTEYTSDTMRAIACKKEIKSRKRKETIAGILALGFFLFGLKIVGDNDMEILAAQGKITNKQESTETISENDFYVICNVDETEINPYGETVLAVVMQDGNLHYYKVTDAPESIYEVCFKTNDLDDYTTYEVVALR
jgi:hypothetical protein